MSTRSAIAVALCLSTPAAATTWRVPEDFATIGAAHATARDGDTILVDATDYRARDELVVPLHIVKSITIRGDGGVAAMPPTRISPLIGAALEVTLADLGFYDSHVDVGQNAAMALVVAETWLTADRIALEAPGFGMVLRDVRGDVRELDARYFRQGAAVVVQGTTGLLTFTDALFEDNAHGAIVGHEVDLRLDRCAFERNASDWGADVLLTRSELAVTEGRFIDGVATGGGGAIAAFGGHVQVSGSTFRGSEGQIGGAILVADGDLGDDATLDVEHATFEATHANQGGGIALAATNGGGLSASVRGSSFIDTLTDGPGASGGGIALYGAALVGVDLRFEGARSGRGGAMSVVRGTAHLTGLEVLGDPAVRAAEGGGGAFALDGAELFVDDAVFSNLTALTGGVLVGVDASATMLRSRITDVTADGTGGVFAIYETDLELDDVRVDGAFAPNAPAGASLGGVITLRDTVFAGLDGGEDVAGLWLDEPRRLDIVRSRFCESRGADGALVAIVVGAGTEHAEVRNSVFVANDATGGAVLGATLAVGVTAAPFPLRLVNNDFLGNQGVAVALDRGDVVFTNNLLARNALGVAVIGGAQLSGDYTLWWENAVDGAGAGAHDLREAPGLVDAPPWGCDANLYLRHDSPARNAGDPAILNADGQRSDIGAFGGPDAGLQDLDGDGYLSDLDCDDTDPHVNPGAEEIWYDEIDQDCDGNLADQDGDGFELGPDCDDLDPSVYPGATERLGGGDRNCDGFADHSTLGGTGCGCRVKGQPSALLLIPGVLALLRRRRR